MAALKISPLKQAFRTTACYQHLLRGKYNAVGGLEDPAYSSEYDFPMQVFHDNGNHWIVASNVRSKQGM